MCFICTDAYPTINRFFTLIRTQGFMDNLYLELVSASALERLWYPFITIGKIVERLLLPFIRVDNYVERDSKFVRKGLGIVLQMMICLWDFSPCIGKYNDIRLG